MENAQIPIVFGTRARTRLVVFLSTYGAAQTIVIARAFRLNAPNVMRSLRSARASGLVEQLRRRRLVARDSYHQINRTHPASVEILALGRALGRQYGVPVYKRAKRRHLTCKKCFEQASDPLNLFGKDASLPGRSHVLLFLSALGAPVPISRLAGVLRKDRFTVLLQVKSLETSGLVASTRHGHQRLLRLNESWPAHAELAALLIKLNNIDATFADLAAAYTAAGGAVAYPR